MGGGGGLRGGGVGGRGWVSCWRCGALGRWERLWVGAGDGVGVVKEDVIVGHGNFPHLHYDVSIEGMREVNWCQAFTEISPRRAEAIEIPANHL